MTRTIEVKPNATATQLVWSGDGPVLLVNTDTTNSVWAGDSNSLSVGDINRSVQIPAGTSIGVDGESDLFAISSTPVEIDVISGGISYAPSAFEIVGTPTVTISGTPTVAISGTPSVSISGTPVISVTGNVDVIGNGGFILPGQVVNLFTNVTLISAGPSSTDALVTNTSCAPYGSLDIGINNLTQSSVANGAAFAANFLVTWFDGSGTITGITNFGAMAGPAANPMSTTISLPCLGTSFTIQIVNIGTVGNLQIPTGKFTVNGSFRQRTKIYYWNNVGNNNLAGSTIGGYVFGINQAGSIGSSNWVCQVNDPSETGTTLAYPFMGHCGDVKGWFRVATNPLNKEAYILDLGLAKYGDGVTTGNNGTIYELGTATVTTLNLNISLPASPCCLIAQSGVAAAAVTFSLVGSNDF